MKNIFYTYKKNKKNACSILFYYLESKDWKFYERVSLFCDENDYNIAVYRLNPLLQGAGGADS